MRLTPIWLGRLPSVIASPRNPRPRRARRERSSAPAAPVTNFREDKVMDEISEIRRVAVDPSPDGPREIGIAQRTIMRPGAPAVVQRFDPPISEVDLAVVD